MIYAIRAGDEGPIKIGRAVNPRSRMAELQIGCPARLQLIAVADLPAECERHIHGCLREERLHGEWFAGPVTLDIVDDLQIRWIVGGDQHRVDDEAYQRVYEKKKFIHRRGW